MTIELDTKSVNQKPGILKKTFAFHKVWPVAFLIVAISYSFYWVEQKSVDEFERQAQTEEHMQKQQDKLLNGE
tara:strand:- start:237 stop:455 length:219 start_codon:yes stop_codon:yes gene_type:complete